MVAARARDAPVSPRDDDRQSEDTCSLCEKGGGEDAEGDDEREIDVIDNQRPEIVTWPLLLRKYAPVVALVTIYFIWDILNRLDGMSGRQSIERMLSLVKNATMKKYKR